MGRVPPKKPIQCWRLTRRVGNLLGSPSLEARAKNSSFRGKDVDPGPRSRLGHGLSARQFRVKGNQGMTTPARYRLTPYLWVPVGLMPLIFAGAGCGGLH